MDVNDNARNQTERGALETIAGKPAQGLRRFHLLYPI